jgi:hypothetical protein
VAQSLNAELIENIKPFVSKLVGEQLNTQIKLYLNQGTADDAILRLASTDVAHGVTDVLPTDVFTEMLKYSATNGALLMRVVGSGDRGLYLLGISGATNTTEFSSSIGCVNFDMRKISGTNVGSYPDSENVFVLRNGGSSLFIVKGSGQVFNNYSTAMTTFDNEKDDQLCRAIELVLAPGSIIKNEFDEFISNTYNKEYLLNLGLISEEGFVNSSLWQMLHNGTLVQHGNIMREMSERIENLERQLAHRGDGILDRIKGFIFRVLGKHKNGK